MSMKQKVQTEYRPVFGVTPSGMRYLKGFAFIQTRCE